MKKSFVAISIAAAGIFLSPLGTTPVSAGDGDYIFAKQGEDVQNRKKNISKKVSVDDLLDTVKEEDGSPAQDRPQEAREFKIGEIVIIDIVESAKATDQAKLDVSREFSTDAEIETAPHLTGSGKFPFVKLVDEPNPDVNPGLKFDASTERTNEGRADRTSSFRTSIAATVVDVKDNGTVVISGVANITINDETQKLVLTGLVRAADIDKNNRVKSDVVANKGIQFVGKGPLSDGVKRGLVGKIFDFLWPF